MKKYHQSPTFGVKSGSKRCTPYVERRNSQDWPVSIYDMVKSQAKDPKKKADNLKAMFDFDPADWSWHKRIMGGSKRAGYREM